MKLLTINRLDYRSLLIRCSLLLIIGLNANAVELIAHRGNTLGSNNQHIPENSLAAIHAAQSALVHTVELDTRVSSDGIVYLFHDDTLHGQNTANLTFQQIKKLAPQTTTLSVVLATTHSTSANLKPINFILDLKQPTSQQLARYVKTITASAVSPKKITFQSNHLEILNELQQALPQSQYFYLERLSRSAPLFLAPQPADILSKLAGSKINGLSIKGRQFLDAAYIKALKSEQLKPEPLKIYIWTINDINRAKFYQSIGADGLITDNTQQLSQKLSQ